MKKESIVFRTAYGHHDPVQYYTYPEGESLTQQEFAQDCDVNRIVGKWSQTGVLTHANASVGDYLDLSDVPTYQDAVNASMSAQNAFMALDAAVRREYDNDPVKFLAAVHDPGQRDRLTELGVFKAAPQPVIPFDVAAKTSEPKTS
jgi:hypothetical protein